MTKRDDTVYLRHILEAIELIKSYLTDVDDKRFYGTRLLQDGVIRQLEIIGEATKNLSQNVRNMAPEVPWKDMAGMRDKLIHQYSVSILRPYGRQHEWICQTYRKLLKIC